MSVVDGSWCIRVGSFIEFALSHDRGERTGHGGRRRRRIRHRGSVWPLWMNVNGRGRQRKGQCGEEKIEIMCG